MKMKATYKGVHKTVWWLYDIFDRYSSEQRALLDAGAGERVSNGEKVLHANTNFCVILRFTVYMCGNSEYKWGSSELIWVPRVGEMTSKKFGYWKLTVYKCLHAINRMRYCNILTLQSTLALEFERSTTIFSCRGVDPPVDGMLFRSFRDMFALSLLNNLFLLLQRK